MGRVILTFLLTSLLWWTVFTYWAYNKEFQPSTEEIESVEELSASQEVEPQPASDTPAKSNKAAEQPTAKKSAPATTQKSTPAREQAPATKQEPVAKGATLDESPQQVTQHQSDSYEIVGKWQPVEGAKNPLEFTKYGTVIQTVYSTLRMRYDYQITGDKMKIRYDNATFKIIKEGNATYLEI